MPVCFMPTESSRLIHAKAKRDDCNLINNSNKKTEGEIAIASVELISCFKKVLK